MFYIASNIKHLRKIKKWSQEALAEKLDISRARIGSYEEERCEPGLDTLVQLSNLFHIAIDALIKCDLRTFNEDAFVKVAENRILFPIQTDKANQDMVEVVSMQASAGYLSGYADPVYIEKLSHMQLPFKAIGKHRAFPIQGDSMPPLQTGDVVVGKFIESWRDVSENKTYILVTKEEGIVYKRIGKKGKTIELQSDNPQYIPYTIKTSDVLELWQFVCAIRNTDTKEEVSMQQLWYAVKGMQNELKEWKKN